MDLAGPGALGPGSGDAGAAVDAAVDAWESRTGTAAGAFSGTVRVAAFPRGSIPALLARAPGLAGFECTYGRVLAQHLQNPELKQLVRFRAAHLREFSMTPADTGARPPRLQGCGYRNLARHATQLVRLSVSLAGDARAQLVPALETAALEHLELYDVGACTSVDAVCGLLARAPRLATARLHGCPAEWRGRGALERLRRAAPRARVQIAP